MYEDGERAKESSGPCVAVSLGPVPINDAPKNQARTKSLGSNFSTRLIGTHLLLTVAVTRASRADSTWAVWLKVAKDGFAAERE